MPGMEARAPERTETSRGSPHRQTSCRRCLLIPWFSNVHKDISHDVLVGYWAAVGIVLGAGLGCAGCWRRKDPPAAQWLVSLENRRNKREQLQELLQDAWLLTAQALLLQAEPKDGTLPEEAGC